MEQVLKERNRMCSSCLRRRVRSSDGDDDDVNKKACHGAGVAAPVWDEIKSR